MGQLHRGARPHARRTRRRSERIGLLGYEIAASRQGRGLATAATRAMLAEAFAHEEVTLVTAHTLPERNASSRVLEKAGFVYDRETREGGVVVWRFSHTRP
jgi:[ribosomal protein S5]-alanine N-acetyltransferase